MTSIKHRFIGQWSSGTAGYENITFDYENYESGEEKGKWAIEGDEIWLIKEDSTDGIK